MNFLRKILYRWANAYLPASFLDKKVYVSLDICPQKGDAVELNLSSGRAYCQSGQRTCPQLQIKDKNRTMILCKANQPKEILDLREEDEYS